MILRKNRGCAVGGRVAAVLANRDGLKVVVLVYDVSEVNVGAQLMKNGSASLARRRAIRQDVERTIC